MKFKSSLGHWHKRSRPILAVMFVMGCVTGALESNMHSKAYKANVIQRETQPTFAEKTAGLERHEGFFPFYCDIEAEKLYLEIDRLEEEFLYLSSLSAGWASTGTWWDSWPWSNSEAALVHFERHGSQIILVSHNTEFRVLGDKSEQLSRSVEETFAVSVLAAFPIIADEAKRILVDATYLFLSDAVNVSGQLRRANQGNYRIDPKRSRIDPERSRAFPENTEIEAVLTFASNNPAPWVQRVTPDGRSLTIRQRHSFIRLPSSDYKPRELDPRMGIYAIRFLDFRQPFDRGYERRWIPRWRLQKKNPNASLSEPLHPIVFYVDKAIPEVYRNAVADGVLYWERALRAAGFEKAIRVEDLPEGSDPMDLRFPAVIRWSPTSMVESSTGLIAKDPRTGEIIKGIIDLETHWVQVNFNSYAALLPALDDKTVSAEDFVMMRLRFVVAHEVGHLLGLYHNNIRASNTGLLLPQVYMDDDGSVRIDVSEAFHAEPTLYDKWVIRYAYTQFASSAEEAQGLRTIVEEGVQQGLLFVTGWIGLNPLATGRLLGNDRLAELERIMKVRRVLLSRFSEAAIRQGEPRWLMFERLIPVYFHHRYAFDSVVKAVGGMEYTYAMRGDSQMPTKMIDPDVQRRALDLLLTCLEPGMLSIPERVVAIIPPRHPQYEHVIPAFMGIGPDHFVYFSGESAPIVIPTLPGGVIDPLGWARALSKMIVDPLLQHSRAARIVSLHARHPESPSLEEVLDRMIEATWHPQELKREMDATLRRVVQRVVLDRLLDLAAEADATPEVRNALFLHLAQLAGRLRERQPDDPGEKAHIFRALCDIERVVPHSAVR